MYEIRGLSSIALFMFVREQCQEKLQCTAFFSVLLFSCSCLVYRDTIRLSFHLMEKLLGLTDMDCYDLKRFFIKLHELICHAGYYADAGFTV